MGKPGRVYWSCGTFESFVFQNYDPKKTEDAPVINLGGSKFKRTLPGLSFYNLEFNL